MKETKLSTALESYLEYLKQQGKNERTIYTYGKDCELISRFFGTDRMLVKILPIHVGKFLKSDLLLKLASGKERAKPTITKTLRVFRMFLVWALENELIEKLPLTKDYPGQQRKSRTPNTKPATVEEQ